MVVYCIDFCNGTTYMPTGNSNSATNHNAHPESVTVIHSTTSHSHGRWMRTENHLAFKPNCGKKLSMR